MMSNLKERFERSCRLCAQEQDVTLLIFSAEAEAMLLQNKLNKYLLIEVDEDDKLPKNICIQCCTKLQTVCDFIDTARKSQEILLNRSIELDQYVSTNVSYEDCHIINNQNNSQLEDTNDEDSKITPMEISVDPMIVLQNCEAMSPNVDDTCQSHNEDVSHLHGLDGENVTIKLIKKGDNFNSENICRESLDSFSCKICTRNFQTEFSLKNHYWTHDVDEINKQDYTCSICNEEFVYKNKLIQHLKIHKTGGNCKICGRLSAEKLTRHMAVHSKESSYTCKICGRSYDTLSNLRAHSVTHSTARPYECNFCPKTFKRNQDLKFHINQHTGAKPYKCPFCDKAFASSGNCYSHRSRMHPGRTVQRNKMVKKPGVNESRQYTPLHPRPIAPKPAPNAKVPKPTPNTKVSKPTPNAKVPKPTPKVPTTPTKPVKFRCHICSHTFMKRDNYTYHMYQHTGEKPFHCTFCSDEFVTRRGLLIHHDIKHPTKNRPLALLSRNALLM